MSTQNRPGVQFSCGRGTHGLTLVAAAMILWYTPNPLIRVKIP